MAINKDAVKRAQRKRIYQKNKNSRLNNIKTAGALYAVKTAEKSNEDDNAGVNALTSSASAGIRLSGRISHSPKTEKIDMKDVKRSLKESITKNLTPEGRYLSHQRAINQSVRSQTQLIKRPKTDLYKKNRRKLYQRLKNKCSDIKANVIHNIKAIPGKVKNWAKKKLKDIALSFLKAASGIVIGMFFIVVFPVMFIIMFTETSSPGIISETLADMQYAYPADENDITRATIHWQSLIISLNNRYKNIPNMVTEQGQRFDYTKTEKCDIEDDTHKILSFLSAYYLKWEFNDDVRNFMTQIFNEMYVIEYGFTSEQKTLTSIIEINKSELPSPLPVNYKVMSEYKKSDGTEIAVVSVSEIKEFVTLNYSIRENKNFDDIVNKYLNDIQKENYIGYYERKGGAIKAFSSPFAFDWTNMITSPFGYRQWDDGSTEFHKGVDFGAANGTEILAISDGVVNVGTGCEHNYPKNGSCGCNGGFGNYVEIICDDGTIILYGHMSQVAVTNGQRVKNGQVIGYSGCTGWSTGFHLHLQMVKDGEYIDPMTFIKPYSP